MTNHDNTPDVLALVRELAELRAKAAATGDLEHPFAAEWDFKIFRDFPAIAAHMEAQEEKIRVAVEALKKVAASSGDYLSPTGIHFSNGVRPWEAVTAEQALSRIRSLTSPSA